MRHRGAVRCVVLAVMVLSSLVVVSTPASAGYSFRRQAQLLPGVELQGLSGNGLSVDVGRVSKGAQVRVEVIPVGPIAGGVDTTSNMCRRLGGILCVNGDFTECRTCTSAFGGIIHDRSLQRSPVSNHPQLWIGPTEIGAGALNWVASIEATLTYLVPSPPVLGGLLPTPPPTERVEKVALGFDAVNRARGGNQVVLYTPPWASTTRTANGGEEATFGGGGPIVGTGVAITPREWKANTGSNAIPADGMVVSAAGAGADRLRAFWTKANDPAAARRSVILHSAVDRPLEESVGGHPVILANGRTLIGDSRDPFATDRHPRTLVGWNPAGDLLIATVDGRQPGHSQGVSLVEAADVLRQIGATSGFNLDGGGSTTFASLASGGTTPQVLNRPSDGNERRVNSILAVIPLNAAAVRSAAAPPPTQPPPAPVGPPPPDQASTDGLPARPATSVAPTTSTTTPPTTVAPATSTSLPPPPETTLPEPPPFELAAPPQPPAPPASPARPATGFAVAAAVAALAAAATGTLRIARRARRAR